MVTSLTFCKRVLLCLVAVLLTISTYSLTARAEPEINCRKYVYAKKCRGVAAKRSLLLAGLRPQYAHNQERKLDDDIVDPENIYLPVTNNPEQSREIAALLQASPRSGHVARQSNSLWSYLAEKPNTYVLPPYRKYDSDNTEMNYDYE